MAQEIRAAIEVKVDIGDRLIIDDAGRSNDTDTRFLEFMTFMEPSDHVYDPVEASLKASTEGSNKVSKRLQSNRQIGLQRTLTNCKIIIW